jgi:hypothetical protein
MLNKKTNETTNFCRFFNEETAFVVSVEATPLINHKNCFNCDNALIGLKPA